MHDDAVVRVRFVCIRLRRGLYVEVGAVAKGECMMETRVCRIQVTQPGKRLYEKGVFAVGIDDKCGKESVYVHQIDSSRAGIIEVRIDEWPALREAIDRMVKECRA